MGRKYKPREDYENDLKLLERLKHFVLLDPRINVPLKTNLLESINGIAQALRQVDYDSTLNSLPDR